MFSVRLVLNYIFCMLGFTGTRDALASAFGLKLYAWPVLKVQVFMSATLLAALVGFTSRWVWNPPSALLVLLALDVLNARYGFLVASRLKGEPWRWSEAQRTVGKIISTLILLALVRNTINAYAYYEYLADALFAWLFSYKLRKLAAKMVALRVQEGGLPKMLLGLLSSKYAPYLVDSLQKPTAISEPAAPEVPATTPSVYDADQETAA